MLTPNSPRAGSRYTDLSRPSTSVSSTSRSPPVHLSSATRPSGDVLQGGSAFGLAAPVWRQSVDVEWRSSRNRITPNPALSAPSTPRSGSLRLSFPHTESFTARNTKINVDLPPRKGDLFRRAGELNELPPPPPPMSRTPRITTGSGSTPHTPHRVTTEAHRAGTSATSTPSRASVGPSPTLESHRKHNGKPSEVPPPPLPSSSAASTPILPSAAEGTARTPLPDRGRASSSPRDAPVLTTPPITPRHRRAGDNSHHEPITEEKQSPPEMSRMTPLPSRAVTGQSTAGTAAPKPVTESTTVASRPLARSTITNERTASISQSVSPEARRYLIPPQREQDVGKLVVVLDLDETLVYSREGGIFQRPGVKHLLEVLKGRCELIVWTAGVRDYALEAIQLIDTCCAVQHCIYRHPMWFTDDVACPKNLRLLGRPLDTVVIVDNTPGVFRLNPDNAILVTDFLGKASCNRGQPDRTLSTLAAIFDHVLTHFPEPRAANILASKRLVRRNIKVDDDTHLNLSTLKHDRLEDLQREPMPGAALVERFAMLRYMNRGRHLNLQ